jgi:dipeptidyl aminopeptidase/acylaminoacyl peptidase
LRDVAGVMLLGVGIATGWIFRPWPVARIPVFHQLTFRRGSVGEARFTLDGATTLYSARWNGEHSRVYMTRGDSPESLALDPPGASLESLWPPGEMLVRIASQGKNVLARVPLTGGGPRPISENVKAADVSPVDHQCAFVRELAGKDQVEYPPGKVIYSTAASIFFLRFAPDGRSLAVAEWPVRGDDAGWVTILDLTGRKKASSSRFASLQGLAWKPNSKEVWFTGARLDPIRNIYAISLSGKERLVYRAPSALTIKDMAAGGRVLLTREDVRYGITGKSASDSSERDFSGFDFSLAIDVSADGKTMLFEEGGAAEEETFVMYLRSLDAQSVVRLGPGSAQALSPDGQWVLAVSGKIPAQLSLVPVGAGENKVLTNDSLNHTAAAWFPDGKRILFEGNEPGKPLRLYVQGVEGGPPTALTPTGTSFLRHLVGEHVISPDGKSLIAFAPDRSVTIYDVESGSSHAAKGFGNDDQFVRWAEQRDEVYITTQESSLQQLVRVYRLNTVTGKRILTKEIPIADPAGFYFVSLQLGPDAKSYFYTYTRQVSTLFLVDGLN